MESCLLCHIKNDNEQRFARQYYSRGKKKKEIHITHSLLNPYLCCSLQEANKKDKFCCWLPWVCCPRNTCLSTWPYLKQVLLFYLAANVACSSCDLVFPNLHLSRNKVLAQLNTCHRGEEGVGVCCDA